MSFQNPRILIAGANGYIGSHVAARLIEMGHNVILTDISENCILKNVNYIPSDFTNLRDVKKIIQNTDLIFFFTGKTGSSESAFNEPDIFISGNEITLINLLNEVKSLVKKPKIIFPSTRLLYKSSNTSKINELSAIETKTIYAANKIACENYLKIYKNCFDIDFTIFRISLPYGSKIKQDRISYGVLSYFIQQAKKNKTLTIYGEGNQKASLIHVEDLSEILIQASFLEETSGEVYNVGGPDYFSMKSIISKLAFKYGVEVKNIEWPEIEKKTEKGNLEFDSSKVENTLNYNYKYTFEKWIKELK